MTFSFLISSVRSKTVSPKFQTDNMALGNDGQCFIPLVSWTNYKLIIMKNKNGLTQFVEKKKFIG